MINYILVLQRISICKILPGLSVDCPLINCYYLINMQVAILGLSTTGKLVTDKLLTDGHELVVWNSSKEELEQIRTEKAEFIVSQKLIIVHTLEETRNILRKPRVLWSMQAPGEPTETLLTQISQFAESADTVVDGSNSNFKDTDRRFGEFQKRGVKFLGVGIAGGVHALENGCCLMVGGDSDAYQYLSPVLESLAKPNGVHSFFGTGGAGHFVQMVHCGIEASMEQAIAEGMALLQKSDYQLDPTEAANTWQGGGIISSFLLDMAMDALIKDPSLSQFDGRIFASSLAKFALDQAKASNVPSPVLEKALEISEKSQYDKAVSETTVAKIVQAMKKEVGS